MCAFVCYEISSTSLGKGLQNDRFFVSKGMLSINSVLNEFAFSFKEEKSINCVVCNIMLHISVLKILMSRMQQHCRYELCVSLPRLLVWRWHVLGYRGYSCEDDTEAASEAMQKLYTALLTLSNLGFLPAIVIACWRWYFVEAIAYVANMIFSTVGFWYYNLHANISHYRRKMVGTGSPKFKILTK